jgi:hypothetical protein
MEKRKRKLKERFSETEDCFRLCRERETKRKKKQRKKKEKRKSLLNREFEVVLL